MDRRQFVRGLAIATGAFGISGLTALTPTRASSLTVDLRLVVEAVPKLMVDGVELLVWQFRDLDGVGPGRLASGIFVLEGEQIHLSVANDLDRSVNLAIPGVLTGTVPIAPGHTDTYAFTAPAPGTYLFHDEINGDLGRARGLAGPMVVMPADGSARFQRGGATFDRQYTLFLHEIDDRVNRAVGMGASFEMDAYEPNYFLVNGLSYPDTTEHDATLLSMIVGEEVALRFINGGLITNPMHFHGYHVNVVSRNRARETRVVEKDTVLVGVDECVDVVLPCNQPGDFPLHTHYVPGVTANGVYVNPYGGALLVMSAAPATSEGA
jgi:FtsP/CotA-like multicopper oxidase with cupredoxin domain